MKQALQAEINKLKHELAKAKRDKQQYRKATGTSDGEERESLRAELDEAGKELNKLKLLEGRAAVQPRRDRERFVETRYESVKDDLEDCRRQAEVLKAAVDASKAANDKELELANMQLQVKKFELKKNRLTKENDDFGSKMMELRGKLEELDKTKGRNADLVAEVDRV